MTLTDQPRCFYCDRTDQQLESCCERHPGDLVCADRAGCRDFILAALRTADLAEQSGLPEIDRQEAIAASWHQQQAERRSDLEAETADFQRRAGAHKARMDRQVEAITSSSPSRSPEEVAELKARLARLEENEP